LYVNCFWWIYQRSKACIKSILLVILSFQEFCIENVIECRKLACNIACKHNKFHPSFLSYNFLLAFPSKNKILVLKQAFYRQTKNYIQRIFYKKYNIIFGRENVLVYNVVKIVCIQLKLLWKFFVLSFWKRNK
jgi:hypothetical protein